MKKQEEKLAQKIKQEREKAAGNDSLELDENVPIDVQSFASYSQI